MEIKHIETLTESQQNSPDSIPENILKLLKELTVDQQLECIYVNQVDRMGIEVLVAHIPQQTNYSINALIY